MKIFR
jgi:hypothetical protein